MTIINENTIVVFTYDELKNILENTNTYTYVYLGANITLTNGIKISSTKKNLIINGTYNNTTYTFEDKKSSSATDTIYVASALNEYVIVKNLNIIGYNYYGTIYVPESNTYKNTIVEYSNITYVGPQISFNPNGLTRFINCKITIQDNYLTGNEIAECNRIEIGGTTTINHTSTANSSFWFRNASPSFTILENAIVNITSSKRELIYGVNNLEFTIKNNAYLSVTTNNGLSYGNFGTKNTIIDTNATFILKQTGTNGSYATWYSYGPITINNNATLEIINNYTGIGTNNYNIYFSTSDSALILNNPKEVILYNEKANVIYTNTTSTFNFTFNRLNLFNNIINILDTITKATLPTYSWYKENDLSTISGTFTSTKTTILENNFTEEELSLLPALSNFIFPNKKIMSVGTFLLHPKALSDTDTTLTGLTLSNASLLITHNDTEATTLADSNGLFSYSYGTTLPIGTTFKIEAKEENKPIYVTKTITIVYSGELIITSVPTTISFLPQVLSKDPLLCPRKENIPIVITDSRLNSTAWKLYAVIDHDLTTETNITLPNSLVFKNQTGELSTLSTTKTLIYTGEENNNELKVTTITWNDNEGILLLVTAPLLNNQEYRAKITWILEE